MTALLFESTGASETALRDKLSELTDREISELLRELVGERTNRRHRPGRGFEAARYRFEIVSDYGAFRDLQRHRMLTVQWQALDRTSAPTCPKSSRLWASLMTTDEAWRSPRVSTIGCKPKGSSTTRPMPCAWLTACAT